MSTKVFLEERSQDNERNTVVEVEKKRLIWLDFLKGLAILAVVVNHVFDTRMPICPSGLICELSFFNVSLFIICGGVSTSMSFEKCKSPGGKWSKSLSRIVSLLGYYTIALVLTRIVYTGRLDLDSFLSTWISFPAQFYFVLFFCELLLVAPLVYSFLIKYHGKYLQSIACVTGIMLIAFYCMFFTKIPQVYGGGGRLFGGSYLFLFAIGSFFALNVSFSEKTTFVGIASMMMIPLAVAFVLKFTTGGSGGLAWALNPPGLMRMGYALSLFIGFYALLKIRWIQATRAVNGLAWFGRHSLDIFLYHMIVLFALLKLFPHFSGWAWAIVCCLLMLLGGVLIGKGVRILVTWCKQCY